jgi:aryl carrier-like protein
MADTVATLVESVVTSLGEDYDDLDVQETFLAWALDSIRELLSQENWPFSQATVGVTAADGSATYTVDESLGDIKHVYRSDDDTPLTFTTLDELRQSGVDYDYEAKPDYWYIHGISSGKIVIGLYPVPNDTYSLLVMGNGQGEALTSTSTLPVPASLYPLVKSGIRVLYKESIQDYNGADRETQRYLGLLQRARARFLTSKATRREFSYSDIRPTNYITLRRPNPITGTGV